MRPMLSTRSLRLIALLFSLSACLAAQTAAWKPFGSSTEGFRALFPAEPEETRSSVPVGGDTYELRSYVAEQGTTALYVGICDYGPKGASADAHELLTSAKSGAMGHMNAHILSEKPIDLGTSSVLQAQGVSFEAENEKLHFSVRMYIADGVLYQVMVATPIGETFADASRFLDSFELLKPSARGAVASAAMSAVEWKPYHSPTDGFNVSFPSVPTVEKQNIATDAGQFELRTYVAEDSSVALIIAVCNYGPTAKNKDPQDLLEHARSGAIGNLKAHLLTEKKINLGANPGTAFEADSGTQHISSRIFLAGSMLYQTMVVSPLDNHYAGTTRFLDSFQIAEK
jgi:hypothetical protein